MAIQPTRGAVPHFSMRPHPLLTGAIIMTLLVGILLGMAFLSQEDGTGDYKHLAVITLIITGILTVLLLILATSKLWFPHLWKRNSSHDRHRQHSRHHPSMRGRDHNRRR